MTFETITLDLSAPVAIMTINRPPMNPLNSRFFAELARAVDEIAAHSEVRALIITGAGSKAFAAGADVTEMKDLDEASMYAMSRASLKALNALGDLDRPVIAAINGFALGGGLELALAADFRLASDTARLGLPEINLGIIPGGGGTQRLPRLIGLGRALELLFTGDMIDAVRAQQIGLVHEVVPQADLMGRARELAEKLASKPAFALALLKSSVYRGLSVDLASGLELESKNFLTVFASQDRREGFDAFLSKRTPNFSGR